MPDEPPTPPLLLLAPPPRATTTLVQLEAGAPSAQPDGLSRDGDGAPTRAPQLSGLDPARRPAFGPARGPRPEGAHGPAHGGPRTARDRAILIRLARMRLLSSSQLRALVFPGRDRSRVSRRVSILVREGWVSTWEERLVIGGRPRYVLPTRRGLAWALQRLRDEADGYAHARLLSTMLASDRHLPIPLVPWTAPAFLPHLREVNDLLTALQTCSPLFVRWASSWIRPLPNRAFGLRLPQPDSIVIRSTLEGPPELLLGEHDRGTEGWRDLAAKLARYLALAQRPALLRELTGFDAFRLVVTVSAKDAAATAARVDVVRRLAREGFIDRYTRVFPLGDILTSPEALLSS